MAGNTHGCAMGRETRNASPAATAYLAVTYFEQGTALSRRGSYREAETYLGEVVRIWPDHAGAWNNLGTAVWQQGRDPGGRGRLSPGPGPGARRFRGLE